MTLVFPQPISRVATADPDVALAGHTALPRDHEIFVWLLDLPSLQLTRMLEFATEAERDADDRRRYRTGSVRVTADRLRVP